nr:bifunctional 2',3'-cyclic-nucleotide 2'-phosphodiesterase/3'-nucleotidase [Aliidiomarina quisquiliarum]
MVFVIGCASNTASAPAPVHVRLLETSDLHAYMLGFDYTRQQPTASYGLAHTAALIHQARAEQPNTLLFDNGDLIQGSALGDWVAEQGAEYLATQVHPVIAALNYLNYDAANLGNHEFNFGLEFLDKTLAGASFPYVSASVFMAATEAMSGMRTEDWKNPLVPPYVILKRNFVDQAGNKQTIHIGVIGFVPPQIMSWDAMHLNGRVYVRDMVAAAQHFVPKMRAEGADIVVAIPHSGLNDHARYAEFSEQATRQIGAVPGIDAILFGHQHRLFPGDPSYDNLPLVDNQQGLVHGIPAVSPGYWGSHLGVIDLTLEKNELGWQVTNGKAELRAVTEAFDEGLALLIKESHEATLHMLNEPLTKTNQPVNSFFARVFPDSSTALINAAQTWFGKNLQAEGQLPANLPILSAAAPFRNGFQSADDYTNIPAGEITLGHLADLYVYPNILQAVKVSGGQLREWLEMSALAFNTLDTSTSHAQNLLSNYPSFNFDVISGVHYVFDVTQPPRYNQKGELINPNSHRVKELSYQGKLVTNQNQFIVMVNNYRAGGGGHFPGLNGETIVYEGAVEVREAIAAYGREQAQAEGRININRVWNWRLYSPTPIKAFVRSADNEQAHAEAMLYKGLHFVESEGAYGRYELPIGK